MPCCRRLSAEWQAKNPDKVREGQRRVRLRVRYGITVEDYEALVAAQDGRCASCSAGDPGGKDPTWKVDHCHETGAVRGLLCNRCNLVLGNCDDDPMILEALVAYLRRVPR